MSYTTYDGPFEHANAWAHVGVAGGLQMRLHRHFGLEFSAGVVYAHQASDNSSANLFHGTASGALVAYL